MDKLRYFGNIKRKPLNYRTYLEIILAIVILIFCECFFFRNVIGTETGALIGDRGDGRLTTLLTEHWWRFFTGKEKFSEIAMFYPDNKAIGYTDLLLGYGIVFSIFRLLGINMYIAYKWTLVFVHIIGTASMYYLLRKSLNIRLFWSLFGTMAFCFSDTFARHLNHTQLDAIAWLPFLLILWIGFIRNFNIRYKRNIYAYSLIVCFVLLTYNSWYIACFTGLFGVIYISVFLFCSRSEFSRLLSLSKIMISKAWKDIIAYIMVMGILYIPFICIYLPVMKSSEGYNYSDCTNYMPEFADIINVTETNLLLGKFMQKLGLSSRGYSGEVTVGFSIILLFLFFLTWILYARKNAQKTIIIASYVSIIVGIISTIRLSANGISLWYIVYTLIPVVRSIRAVARFLLWLSFPMSVVTSYIANRYFPSESLWAGAAVVMIFFSNINKVGISQYWNYTDELKFISNVSAPPKDLESFYIIDTDHTEDQPYIYQLDAYEIANEYSVKTINGYSGKNPKGWDGIWDVSSGCYETNVFNWADQHKLKNVYAYDRATDAWIPIDDRYQTMISDVFCPNDNKFSVSSGLEDMKQGEYAWTSKEFETHILNREIKDSGLVIKMKMHLSSYLAQDPEIDPYIHIFVDGQLVSEVEVSDDYIELNIPMSEHEGDEYDIQIKTNCFFNPKSIGINEDTRNLSLAMYYIGN